MGRNVFANGLEISAKASDNRSIAAMPDVCLSPPGPPSGPVPIPYPNSAFARHTTRGSRTVKIGGREVGKKNISKYGKSTGDEPATRNFGMGVISHNITGPMKFAAWSMDVKVEGANVNRHMDLTTHNHSNGGNNPGMDIGEITHSYNKGHCSTLAQKNNKARKRLGDGNYAITHASHKAVGKKRNRTRRACSSAEIVKKENGWDTGLSTKDSIENLDTDRTKYIDTTSETPKTQIDKPEPKPHDKHSTLACFGFKEGGKSPHRYIDWARTSNAAAAHTEAKIIDEIYKTINGHGGTLLLCIDYPKGENDTNLPLRRRSPCKPRCQPLICEVQKAGCLTIVLCDQENNPVPPDCPP
ncbi:DUF4150 domain-containing protein [Pseudomonas sp. SK3(2021)]|uniref:DUF4150 domain-containing protein n=1 Tax=Pseudomonas sp. SK3(2021) TaxID=2841064 RepID=UPI00192B1304|nr:DUF4150 domain-containing protein [Pseudomonas sp. SK3(2021)]QQZ41619.1 DUF4150 domain-containing protein [Pseudomonas sp. SK3(2021)]